MRNSKFRCTHRTVCNLAGQELKSILSDQVKKLQRRGRTIVSFIDTLSAFVEKLENWKRKAQTGNFAMFRESCHGGWI